MGSEKWEPSLSKKSRTKVIWLDTDPLSNDLKSALQTRAHFYQTTRALFHGRWKRDSTLTTSLRETSRKGSSHACSLSQEIMEYRSPRSGDTRKWSSHPTKLRSPIETAVEENVGMVVTELQKWQGWRDDDEDCLGRTGVVTSEGISLFPEPRNLKRKENPKGTVRLFDSLKSNRPSHLWRTAISERDQQYITTMTRWLFCFWNRLVVMLDFRYREATAYTSQPKSLLPKYSVGRNNF